MAVEEGVINKNLMRWYDHYSASSPTKGFYIRRGG